MAIIKRIFFILCCLLSLSVNAQLKSNEHAVLTVEIAGVKKGHLSQCSSSLQSCSIQITTQNSGCNEGFISITNNSRFAALNVSASSTDPNFLANVIQNNACPAVLLPGASCSISFYTRTPATFTVSNVMVKGTNTNASFFNMNAFLCAIISIAPTNITFIAGMTSPPVTITNTVNSFAPALNVAAFPASPLTVQSTNCPSSLAIGASCQVTFAASGATTQNVPIEGTNTNTVDLLVTVTLGHAILTPSVNPLALSVNDPGIDPALTGNPRIITMTNTGTASATNVTVSSSGFPTGTTVSSTTCTGTLAVGNSCTITITPGAVATSDVSSNPCNFGTAPVAGTVTTSADGFVSTQVSIYVLLYACQYQGGWIYAVDDTTPNTGSIGGSVVSLVDQAEPEIGTGPQATSIIWSSNGSGAAIADVSDDTIPGIDDTSIPGTGSPTYAAFAAFFAATYTNANPFTPASFAQCDGLLDGQCNSGNILVFYNQFITNYNSAGTPPFTASPGPTNVNFYAEGLCTATINGFSDWYLPGICQMDAVSANPVTCPANTQSMLGSISFIGDPNAPIPSTSCNPPPGTDCLAGGYWSSTEASSGPQNGTWFEFFEPETPSQGNGKNGLLGVRCSRNLTF